MASLRPITSRCLFAASSPATTSTITAAAQQIPDYPYGPFRTYKQRNAGLYGTSKIRFGNTVSAKWHIKAATHWKPNRHTKRLWSPSLGMFIRTRLTTGVLRTIDKLGGIDNYLLGAKSRRLKELGPAGWRLRWKERWAREREAMGLPPKAHQLLVAEQAGGAAPSEELLGEMDRMLAHEEEFVLGEETDGGQVMIELKQPAQETSEPTKTA
ncbi:hypothetical protein PG997_000126 [Apiospora hydei]|uniref:Uncharacterized protein n=1 Tax=Apiospora hydei TaxID=1337664 RepID=A0ABR1X9P2_9PEZI